MPTLINPSIFTPSIPPYGGTTLVQNTSATNSVQASAGVGDLLIVTNRSATPPGGGAALPWTLIDTGGGCYVYYRLLSFSDLSSPITYAGSGNLLVYNGPTSLASRVIVSHQGSPGSGTMAGFTKNINYAGRIGLYHFDSLYDASMSLGSQIVTIVPSGVRIRIQQDISQSYVNNTTTSIGWDTANPSGPSWSILEMLHS